MCNKTLNETRRFIITGWDCELRSTRDYRDTSSLGWPLFSKVKNIEILTLHIVPIDEKNEIKTLARLKSFYG